MGGHDVKGYEYRLRHIVFHKLSPFELSCTRTLIQLSKTLPLRIKKNFWVVPTFGLVFLLKDHMERTEYLMDRKNPKDFENDV